MNDKIRWLLKPYYFKIQKMLMIVPDITFIKRRYKKVFGKAINLDTPKTYSEKLNWLKLYDRRPEYGAYVDKVRAKEIATSVIGDEYIIPTLGVWDNFDDIDFGSLPDAFVLKCTHDSGSFVLCSDKADFDYGLAKKKLNSCLKRDYYWASRESQYKGLPGKIIAEPYLGGGKPVDDYKFYVFDGVVKAMFISSGRGDSGETYYDFFDADFNHLDFTRGHPNAPVCPERPEKFDEMIKLSEKLGKGFPHIRIDLYVIGGKIYFGEYTFFSGSGLHRFEPEKWDSIFGEWIDISDIQRKNNRSK